MENTQCIICDSKNYRSYLKVDDRFDEGNTFNLDQCVCGFIFLNPRPSEKDISKYYDAVVYDPHKSNSLTLFDRIYNFIKILAFNRKYKLIKNLYKIEGKHLDVGGGKGDFCSFMKKNNWDTMNQDTSSDALNISKANGVQSVCNLKDIESKSIDLVTAWHSIEHIHSINTVLDHINRILKFEKYFILCVPNSNAIEQKFYKSNWVAWDAPRHLYHFNPDLIKAYLKKFNFEVIYYESLPQDTVYNIILSINKKNILEYIKSFFAVIISLMVNMVFGYKKSSSFIAVCKKS